MNRNQMLRNYDTAINVSLLQNKLQGELTIATNEVNEYTPQLRQYTSVIITSNPEVLTATNADIFLDLKNTPYNKNILDIDMYNNFPNTIFVINKNTCDLLKRAHKILNNYMLLYNYAVINSIKHGPAKVGNVKYGLSRAQPLEHLANICAGRMIGGNKEALAAYIDKKNKYGFPENQLYAERDNLIEAW